MRKNRNCRYGRLGVVGLILGCLSLMGVASAKVTVVTTTTHVTDMVKTLGGAEVEVISLMGPGVDPHLYKPSARDVGKLRKADAIFYSGLMLEGRMADLFFKMARRGAKVYAVTESIPEDKLLEPEEFEGHWDPHVWFDAEIWSTGIDVVVEGLSMADPKNATLFKKRGAELKSEYLKVHQWALKRISSIPESERILVTSHDAFNYFGRAFGFKVVAVQGISTASEAGLTGIVSMVDFIKKNNVKAIFVESSVSPAAMKRISSDSGAVIGGELFSDAMGIPGHIVTGPDGEQYDEGTWVGMIKHNVNTIVEALKPQKLN